VRTEHTVGSPGKAKNPSRRERAAVLALGGGIVSVLVVYLALSAASGSDDPTRNLLPYQTLAETLPELDQRTFRAIRGALPELEARRAATQRWAEVDELVTAGVPPFAGGADGTAYEWSKWQEGAIINYLGLPKDPAQPAWILEIQEPEPWMPPDPSPVDNEHHRLPDGTMIHLYTWMYRYGGQVTPAFVRQPYMSGWTEVFIETPNPLSTTRR
jgi:hypothetical protein